jgi:tRNA modification GTPase
MLTNDIICAIATPPGKSALAIVRISGPGCIALVSKAIPALRDVGPDDSHKLRHDFILDSNSLPLDEITVIPYFAPKSYTAEEMVEIICHGGFASSKAVIRALTDIGARIAEPGEFTKRAFLNGRISLSEAEAVAAAIEAKSELALKAAARNLKGELYIRIDEVRRHIADLLTLLEAEIDFSEDEIEKTSLDTIKTIVAEQLEKSEAILKSYDFGRGLNSGYKVVIVGRANVGKSSLLNALLRRERAIVTDIPGTTRDTLTEWIEIDGFPILLTDTAGLRESLEEIEKIGQERTRTQMADADVIFFVIDGSSGISAEDKSIFRDLNGKATILIVNKTDLGLSPDLNHDETFPNHNPVFISAIKGDGLEELKLRLARCLSLDKFNLDSALLATERQYLAMKKAHDSLTETLQELGRQASHEILSFHLRETLDHLGELVGETSTEDILNNIFGRFCIGK